eukprot:g21426.t1
MWPTVSWRWSDSDPEWAEGATGERSEESLALEQQRKREQARFEKLRKAAKEDSAPQIDPQEFRPAEFLRATGEKSWQQLQTVDGVAIALGSATRALFKAGGNRDDADDWPRFRGPQQDGIVRNTILRTDFSNDDPPASDWATDQRVGHGWSSFAVVDGLAFTLEQRGERETTVCYDFATGAQIWTKHDEVHFHGNLGGDGPRSTPTVYGGRLYTLGATGILNCRDLLDGKMLWTCNILTDAGAKNLVWGISASPLVVGNLVYVNPGGGSQKNRAVIAYNRLNGEMVWTNGEEPASYCTPSIARIHGVDQLLIFSGWGLIAYNPHNGAELWKYPWTNQPKVNAAQPIVVDNQIFISSGYGSGCALLTPKLKDGKWSVDAKVRENQFRLKFNDGVYKDGFVYGLDETILACVDFKTLDVKWKMRGKFGYGQMLLVDDKLLITTEAGDVVLIPATSKRPKELARFRGLNRHLGTFDKKGVGWNHPVLVDGKLLMRNDREAALGLSMQRPGAFTIRALFLLAPLAVTAVTATSSNAFAADTLHQQIDRLIAAKTPDYAKIAAPVTSDAEFLRRITLDLTGTIPTAAQVRAFLADKSADKRVKVVDRLLASPEYARHMQRVFDVMLMRRLPQKNVSTTEWQKFLRESFAKNKPWDQLVREILAADGRNPKNRGPAAFYLDRNADVNEITRDIGDVFLGADLECAQCHNHPEVDDFKQEFYYGISAFLVRSYLFKDKKLKKSILAEKGVGEVSFESVFEVRDKKSKGPKSTPPKVFNIKMPGEPKFKKGQEYKTKPSKTTAGVPKFSRRAKLPEVITSPKNTRFARTAVNRVWAMLLGRGIVHPLDMDHSGNPPSHPKLLDLLTKEFQAHQFDLKWLIREIVLSQTYQRASKAAPSGSSAKAEVPPESTFAQAILRPLSPAQFAWAALEATGQADVQRKSLGKKLTEEALHKRLVSYENRWVSLFGGQPGNPPEDFQSTVDQVLFLCNDKMMVSLISPRSGNLADRLSKIPADQPAKIAEELFIVVLSRKPTPQDVADEGRAPKNLDRPSGLTLSNDERRRQLRRKISKRFSLGRRGADTEAYNESYDQAASLMAKKDVFDFSRFSDKDVARYGKHDFGRHCLMARRLVEEGVTFTKVEHRNYDTHSENFNFHLEQLGEFDQPFATFIGDLADRGLMEHTLVIVMCEFGRTPRINYRMGRDHWGTAWSIALGGCGIKGGAVAGKTNANGTRVIDRQVNGGHLFHTYYQAVGIDSTEDFYHNGRPFDKAPKDTSAIKEILA